MNQDKEHLRLLAIFHYIVAGLAALFSLFPLLYTTIGAIFIFASRHPAAAGPKPSKELPPEFLGWIFVVLGLFLFLLGIAMAICILIAGRCVSPQQALHLCAGNGLHRMSLHSFRNNSRGLYDYCVVARVRERIVCGNANLGLKIARS
jgi:hypothetical protein